MPIQSPPVITSHWTVNVDVNLLNELVIDCSGDWLLLQTHQIILIVRFSSAKHQREDFLQIYEVALIGIEPLILAALEASYSSSHRRIFCFISGNFPNFSERRDLKCKYVREKWEKCVSPPRPDDTKTTGLESCLTVKWCSGSLRQISKSFIV